MDCTAAQEIISAEIDREATMDERVSLTGHLAVCARCRAWRTEAEDLNRLIGIEVASIPSARPWNFSVILRNQ